MSWTATGQQAFSRSFAYDSLDRLSQMQETSGNQEGCKPSSSPTNPYTLSWTIDPWGNRTNQTPSAGTCSFSQTVNSQNQLVGPPYQYDAAGNLTYDGSHTYFYDAENHLAQVDGTFGNCSTATACYLYDAAGHRARKAVGAAQTNYIYGLDGNVISEVDQNNTWMNVYLHMNGQFIAQYLIGLPRTQFILSDHLGSARILTKYDGTLVDSLDFLPFGEQIAGGSGTTLKFTDDERDSESNLDHTWFRQYSSQLGRWMHPDPAGLAAVDPTNPESWNRYAYVSDDPLDYIDPYGLFYGPCGPFDDFCSGPTPPPPPFPPCIQAPQQSCGPTPPTGPSGPSAGGGGGGTIGPGSLDILNDYCSARGRAKFIADWLPGGAQLVRNFWGSSMGEKLGFYQLSAADLNRITGGNSGGQTVAVHAASEGLKAAAGSTAFLSSLRASTGIPKTVASTWLSRLSVALIVGDAVAGFYKEGKEILACQAGN